MPNENHFARTVLLVTLFITPLVIPSALANYPAVPVVQGPTVTNQILVKSTEIRVNSNLDNVQRVEVQVNGKVVKAEVSSDGTILVGALIGPKDKVQVTIQTDTGISADVKVAKSQGTVSLANVNFATNSFALTKNSRKLLDQVANIVKSKGYQKLSLTGYTDSDGSAARNQSLSLARANAVSSYLKSKRVRATITVAAKAALNPVSGNDTVQGKALNRRVEITVS
jgi:outer membrane protein OmpA-like peptidoglycan-associated protein